MKSSLRLFRIAGIDVGVHYTWVFIFVLITWSLITYFPQAYPGWSTGALWVTSIVTALALFASVLIHELAHSLVARSRGLPVNSITLFLLGGVSNLEKEPEQPRTEFFMALAGPATSLGLALLFWLLTLAMSAGSHSTPLYAVLSYLALINLILGIFNMLPGFPLDGGRVLRSIVWASTGNLNKATTAATTVGRVIAWLMIGYGVYQIFLGNWVGGIWLAFIGFFLNMSADSSRRETMMRRYLVNVKVKDVMSRESQTIPPETTVDQLVTGVFHGHHERAVPVCRDGRLEGIVSVTDVKKLPRENWATTHVEQIMTREPLYTVSPDDPVNSAFELIARHNINQVIVMRQGDCAGMLNRADLIHYLELNRELSLSDRGR